MCFVDSCYKNSPREGRGTAVGLGAAVGVAEPLCPRNKQEFGTEHMSLLAEGAGPALRKQRASRNTHI